ncbi:MAG: class I SAM-dependent methyltransferase [Phycisphaerae bacterium]|nr:class I SAM-dependent methyltransferase [Phycisphaerae bacterium]
MSGKMLKMNFYDRIKPRLYERIGRELRLAGRVLDLGCGACGLVKYLAQVYRQHVTGVDISSADFPKRPRSSRNARIRYVRKDAAHLDFAANESVDAVVVLWALHEMKHARTILREAKRVLRPGGEILIVEFPRDSLAQRLWGEDYYSPEELAGMLDKAGYQETSVRLIERRRLIWARGFRPERLRKTGTAS